MDWSIILFEALFYVCFIGLFLKSVNRKEGLEEYFSKNTAQCLKGLCCLAIFCHHYGQLSGEPALNLFTHFGYLALNIFLMISGYGISYGFKNKPDYLERFLVRRCGRVALCYWGMNGITVCLNYVLYGRSNIRSIGHVIRILLGLDVSYCLSSWYFVMLFWLYLLFYLIARFTPKYFQLKMFVIVSAAVIFGIIADMPLWFYNYLYAFNVGIYMAFRQENKINKAIGLKLLCSIGAFLVLFTVGKVDRIVSVPALLRPILFISAVFSSMAFTMAFMFLLDRIRMESKFLYKLGSISTGIYVFHTCIILNPLLQSHLVGYTKNWGISLWISLLVTIVVSMVAKGLMNIGKNLWGRKP